MGVMGRIGGKTVARDRTREEMEYWSHVVKYEFGMQKSERNPKFEFGAPGSMSFVSGS